MKQSFSHIKMVNLINHIIQTLRSTYPQANPLVNPSEWLTAIATQNRHALDRQSLRWVKCNARATTSAER
jgi:hypothetical protein